MSANQSAISDLRFAIVTPSYNTASFIGAAIESVFQQDYPDVDYVVMDGGSTDKTTDVLRGFGDRVRWFSQRDAGQSDAINRGFGDTRGDILGWLNADDAYAAGAFRKAADFFETNPRVAVVYGDADFIDAGGMFIARLAHIEPFDRNRLRRFSDFIVQPAAFFRRSAFEAVGGLDPALNWAMDYDLWLKLAQRYEFAYIPEVLAHYRWLGDSKTASGGWGRLDEVTRVAKKHGLSTPAYFRLERVNLHLQEARQAMRYNDVRSAVVSYLRAAGTLVSSMRAIRSLASPRTWKVIETGRILRAQARLESRIPAVIRAILFDILGPIMLLIFLGGLMRRKFAIDVGSLSKLNLYLFTPAFMFDQVSKSKLSWPAMGGIVIVSVLQVVMLGLVVWGIGKALRLSHKTLAAVALAVMFYNSANYGLPLATLAFPGHDEPVATAHAAPDDGDRDGAAVQTFVAFSQSTLSYTVGLTIAAWAGTGSMAAGIAKLLRLPILPAIAAALLARWWVNSGHGHLPIVVEVTARYLSAGLVPIALVTLGAQLALRPRWPRWRPVSLVLVLRLIFGPIQMAAMLYGLHLLGWPSLDLWPWPAHALILTAGVPTAVVTLLLTLEMGGDADLAADCVFWTTVFSCITIMIWLVVLRLAAGG